jgi:hypothetical protein
MCKVFEFFVESNRAVSKTAELILQKMHPKFRHFRHSRQFRHLGSLRMENVEKQYEQLAHLVVAGATE